MIQPQPPRASLWSGYALPTRRPTTAINGDSSQGNHLSEPKRCSDQPGHLSPLRPVAVAGVIPR